jgi:transaldolase
MMNASQKLFKAGQSVWYDNIQRRLLKNGEMARMIAAGEIRGVTSNPSIFMNAIAKTNDYDDSLVLGLTPEEVFFHLAIEDIQATTDLFRPLYNESNAGDGYVSLEVSPYLANDTVATLAQAKALWARVDRPNLMIKIPATKAGLPAITEAIAAGINVNVTLIFSLERYAEVMEAYLSGLEKRAAAGLPLERIASVASFFVSRVDTNVDARLQKIIAAGNPKAAKLLGKAAIANARLAYADYKKVFTSERFLLLKAKGARVQRPLWASTSTKNPAYRDVIYIEELIGPDTVNTVPPQTLVAFLDHGTVRPSLEEDLDGARKSLAKLEKLGISMAEVTYELEVDGVKAFADAFTVLLKAIEDRLKV